MGKILLILALLLCASGATLGQTPGYADNGVSCSNCQATNELSQVINLRNPSSTGNTIVLFGQWGQTTTTATVTDDQGNTYVGPANGSANGNCVPGNQEVCMWVAFNAVANTRKVTVTFSVATTTSVSLAIYEFFNVATTRAAANDGVCTGSSTGTAMTCGAAIGANGDLGVYWCSQDTSATANVTFTEGASWTPLTKDVLDSTAFEFRVLTAATTPTMTMSASNHFDCVGAALKPATAGGAPTGTVLSYSQHNAFPANASTPKTWTLQFPCPGANLITANWIGVDGYTITISDSTNGAWTKRGADVSLSGSGVLEFFDFINPTCPAAGLTLSVVTTGTDISGSTLILHSIKNAAASPFDATMGVPTNTGTQGASGNLTALSNVTPSTANGIVFFVTGVSSNTVNGINSPAGNFLSCVPAPIASPDHVDQNNGWAIFYNPDTSPENLIWTTTGGAVGNWAAAAIHYKGQAGGGGGGGGGGTAGIKMRRRHRPVRSI